MPLANGARRSTKKRTRAAHELYTQHLAKLPDGGANLHGFCRTISIPRSWIARPRVGDKLTNLQPCRIMSRSRPGLRRYKNRKLRSHRERRGRGDRFLGEGHPERLAALGWDANKDYGRVRRCAPHPACAGISRRATHSPDCGGWM
jgi:hypothetical protein